MRKLKHCSKLPLLSKRRSQALKPDCQLTPKPKLLTNKWWQLFILRMTHGRQEYINKSTKSFLSPPSSSLHSLEPSVHVLRGDPSLLGASKPYRCQATVLGWGEIRVFSSFALGCEPNLYFVTDLFYPVVSFSYLLWELSRLRKYSAGQPEN